jgi:hypothetical protein
MSSQKDGDGSNILSFPEPASELSVFAHVRESVVTAEGLLLMQAFFKITSSADRKTVIALAERLAQRDDDTLGE